MGKITSTMGKERRATHCHAQVVQEQQTLTKTAEYEQGLTIGHDHDQAKAIRGLLLMRLVFALSSVLVLALYAAQPSTSAPTLNFNLTSSASADTVTTANSTLGTPTGFREETEDPPQKQQRQKKRYHQQQKQLQRKHPEQRPVKKSSAEKLKEPPSPNMRRNFPADISVPPPVSTWDDDDFQDDPIAASSRPELSPTCDLFHGRWLYVAPPLPPPPRQASLPGLLEGPGTPLRAATAVAAADREAKKVPGTQAGHRTVAKDSEEGQEVRFVVEDEDGRWEAKEGVRRDQGEYPLWQPGQCGVVFSKSFDCVRMGRTDMDFMRFRWQPHGCRLPRFNAKRVRQQLAGRRLVFVGDSLARNQFQSMLCLLSRDMKRSETAAAPQAAEAAGTEEAGAAGAQEGGGLQAGRVDVAAVATGMEDVFEVSETNGSGEKLSAVFLFKDFNFTVEYYISRFLLYVGRVPAGVAAPPEIWSAINTDFVDTVAFERMRKSKRNSRQMIVVLNAGHWFTREKFKALGAAYLVDGVVRTDMGLAEGFRRGMDTVARWMVALEQKLDATVVWRTYAPSHFMDGSWNNHGRCDAKHPLQAPAGIDGSSNSCMGSSGSRSDHNKTKSSTNSRCSNIRGSMSNSGGSNSGRNSSSKINISRGSNSSIRSMSKIRSRSSSTSSGRRNSNRSRSDSSNSSSSGSSSSYSSSSDSGRSTKATSKSRPEARHLSGAAHTSPRSSLPLELWRLNESGRESNAVPSLAKEMAAEEGIGASNGTGEGEGFSESPEMMGALALEVIRSAEKQLLVLDITGLSQLRHDGHMGRHWTQHKGYDCSHWCLPGVPDTWNELLLALLTQHGRL